MLKVKLSPEQTTEEVLNALKEDAMSLGLNDIDLDFRPWGGELIFADENLDKFLDLFYKDYSKEQLGNGKLSLKYLVLAPGKRFSWQYHQRRGEVWKVIYGPVGAFLSQEDACPEDPVTKENDDLVIAEVGTRHRLKGLDNWGVVAEIWVHTDPNSPSTEDDNTRLQDDFGRN